MANERDNAFNSTGIGMGQGTDFDTPSTGTFGTDRTTNETGEGAPITARAKEAVSTAGHKAVDRVQERIADQVTRATGQLESVASSLRTAGAQMPPENGIGRYMVQAATQVDNLASFLNNREVGELVDEVEDFARRQPAVFIGGAFALGILGARFLRSSRQGMGLDTDRGYRRSYSDDGYGNTSAGSSSSGLFGDTSQNYGTGYSAGSTQPGSGLSSSGYGAGSTQSGSGYASSTPGGTIGTNTGLGASSGLGSTSTGRDLASDIPSGSRGFGTSTEGMSGSSTSRSGSFGSGASTRGNDSGSGSLSSDDETRTTGFGSDSLSARSDSGTDRDSLDSDADRKSPDFL